MLLRRGPQVSSQKASAWRQLSGKTRIEREMPFESKMKVEASVARCLRTPPDGAYPARTLSIGITNRLRGLRYRSIVVVGNYGLVHHGGTIPGKSTSFTPSSILFRPRWWSRRVLPPGPKGLLQRPFITIAGLRRHPEYRAERLTKKEP